MLRNATVRSGARKHISASSLAALECTYCSPENENAELVCNHQWMRKDSVGPILSLGCSFGDSDFCIHWNSVASLGI